MNVLEGKLTARGLKIGIVVARFNEFITSKLLSGCVDCLLRHEAADEDITVAWVPGAFEIGFTAKKIMLSGKYDGIMTLGAVIKGETDHYSMIIQNVTNAIMQINLEAEIPVTFGILTTDDIEQALQRAGLKAGNEGSSTAQSLLEMISLNKMM